MIIRSKKENWPLILSAYWSIIMHIEPNLLVEFLPVCIAAQSTEFWLYFILVAAGGPRYEFEYFPQENMVKISDCKSGFPKKFWEKDGRIADIYAVVGDNGRENFFFENNNGYFYTN